MPLVICNFILKSADRRAMIQPLPFPCWTAGSGPSEDSAKLHQIFEQLFSFGLLNSSGSPAGVHSHCQDRDLI